MNSPEPATAPTSPRPRSRLRFELIFASVWLAVGLFALPALIFLVGVSLLGPYGEAGAGLGRFYADFFADLAEPSGRAWALALGPLVLVSLVRAMFLGMPRRGGEPEDAVNASHNERPRAAREQGRVEPRVELD